MLTLEEKNKIRKHYRKKYLDDLKNKGLTPEEQEKIRKRYRKEFINKKNKEKNPPKEPIITPKEPIITPEEPINKGKEIFKDSKENFYEKINKGKEIFEDVQEKGGELIDKTIDKGGELIDKTIDKGGEFIEDVQEKGGELINKGGEIFEDVQENVYETVDKIKEEAEDLKDKSIDKIIDFSEKTQDFADKLSDEAYNKLQEVKDSAYPLLDKISSDKLVKFKEDFIEKAKEKYNTLGMKLSIPLQIIKGGLAFGGKHGKEALLYEGIDREEESIFKKPGNTIKNLFKPYSLQEEEARHNPNNLRMNDSVDFIIQEPDKKNSQGHILIRVGKNIYDITPKGGQNAILTKGPDINFNTNNVDDIINTFSNSEADKERGLVYSISRQPATEEDIQIILQKIKEQTPLFNDPNSTKDFSIVKGNCTDFIYNLVDGTSLDKGGKGFLPSRPVTLYNTYGLK